MTIPDHVPPFYAMLKDVGIDAGAQHPMDAERNNQTLQAIDGFKTEWFPAMKQFILEHDVTNIPTVLKGMTAWVARGGPPQERTAKADVAVTYSDAAIVAVLAAQNEQRCNCETWPECQPEWRRKVMAI